MYGSTQTTETNAYVNATHKTPLSRWYYRFAKVILVVICTIFAFILVSGGIKFMDSKSIVASTAKAWDKVLDTSSYVTQAHDIHHYFKIYAIVSNERQEYLEDVLKNMLQWNEKEGDVTFIDAIDQNTLNQEQLIIDGALAQQTRYIPQRVACVLSHKKALERFLGDDDAEYALILEDDITLNPLLEYEPEVYINKVMDIAPIDWELINFGRCWDWCYSSTSVDKDGFLQESMNPICAHMYAVTKAGAQKILSKLLPLQVGLNIDQLIARKIRNGQLRGYSTTIPILLQNKAVTGSLAAPGTKHPYRLCTTFTEEIMGRAVDNRLCVLGYIEPYSGSSGFGENELFGCDGGFQAFSGSSFKGYIEPYSGYSGFSENDVLSRDERGLLSAPQWLNFGYPEKGDLYMDENDE
eukprot:118885_1